MKYYVNNQLDLFEFHDCEISFVSFDNKNLVVSAKHLNIHEDAKHNPYDCDMEICLAHICFCDIKVASFEPSRAYQQDADGNWYTDDPPILYKGDNAQERFIKELKDTCWINGIDIQKTGERMRMEISATAPDCFSVVFLCSHVTVEWDAYSKKAWYELHKQHHYYITLLTPTGEENAPVHIVCHEEDVSYQGNLEQAPIVDVGVQYQGQFIWGQGKDYMWMDAFADLQRRLPDGVILKGCLTCRHGNMCPFGGNPGEVFCTRDLQIASKEDLCRLFSTDFEWMEKRSRGYTDVCEDYQHQSIGFYTYSDYLHELYQ